QFVEGARILAGIREAFRTGKESYVIPPGNYRFESVYRNHGGRSFALKGMHADPAKPFRIIGHGATLWFGLSEHPAPHHHQMVKVVDCSHLSLEGITVDSDPRGSMDARITAFDFDGNRIQVKPVTGTRLLQSMPAAGRCIPFKADGRHVAALYQIDQGWGPGNFFTMKTERTSDGLYWFTLKDRKLLETIRNEAWRKAYGSAGILEVGDMLGFVYSSSGAIALEDCREITVRDSRFFGAKAGLEESGGYGAHRWINCHFMARPGTNNLLGGDGTMMNACMRGSVFERCVIQRTTDDAFNNHGYWKRAVAVAGRSITFKAAPPRGLAAGQLAEAYDARTERRIGRLTVESVDGKTVVFKESLGPEYASASVMFLSFQNAGWVIRDSIFADCYQRVVLACGPGLFEGNRLERVGAGLTLGNGRPVDIEGGDPHGVVIRGNVFLDAASSPALRAIRVHGTGVPLRGLEITGNLFVGTGAGAVHVNHTEGAVIRDNLILRPFVGNGVLPSKGAPEPIILKNQQGCVVVGNRTITDSPDLAERLAQRMRQHEESAAAILKDVRAETLGK
ncbi:MAG: hypothetical protein EBR95_01280, partial [Verrucomicrobia bacterium]|nr:hypothetical protein [Verrucomicrobiota bacterium]